MNQAGLFDNVKSTSDLLASIDLFATRNCISFHWCVGSSRLKNGHRQAAVSFVGDLKTGKPIFYSESADSLDHALFLLHEYLINL